MKLQLFDVRGPFERHPACMDLQDLLSVRFRGDTYLYLTIKSSGAPERRVDRIRPVCCPYYDNLPAIGNSIHHSQKLGNYTAFHFSGYIFTPRGNRVKFVDKDNRRSVCFSFFKNFPQPLFGLPIVF